MTSKCIYVAKYVEERTIICNILLQYKFQFNEEGISNNYQQSFDVVRKPNGIYWQINYGQILHLLLIYENV